MLYLIEFSPFLAIIKVVFFFKLLSYCFKFYSHIVDIFFPEGLAVGVGFGAIGKTPAATFENARLVI